MIFELFRSQKLIFGEYLPFIYNSYSTKIEIQKHMSVSNLEKNFKSKIECQTDRNGIRIL